MEERRRRYYLTALGIEPWCARWPLPGGAASPECSPDPVVVPGPSVDPEAMRTPGVPRTPMPEPDGAGQGVSLEAVREALEPQDSGQPDTSASQAQESPDPEPTQSSEERPLDAIIWHGDRFTLMAAASPDLPSERQVRLGQDILRALGASARDEAIILRWPPFENPALPGNDSVAFTRVLERVRAPAESHQWVILGAEVHQLLEGPLNQAGHSVALVVASTLQDLLSDPGAKRALWERMKPLTGERGTP